MADFRLPEGVDKPVIIGEFHFGALDRGMFHTGPGARRPASRSGPRPTRPTSRGALDNPLIVGTHWFQFGDQATTGRGDGENYQIGFLDVCDTPYPGDDRRPAAKWRRRCTGPGRRAGEQTRKAGIAPWPCPIV